MNKNFIILSIKPKYADLIFQGKKKVELRRILPNIELELFVPGSNLYIPHQNIFWLLYETAPRSKIRVIIDTYYVIKDVLVEDLWSKSFQNLGISKKEFDKYFKGKTFGNGIRFDRVIPFIEPLFLSNFGISTPPQNFCYARKVPGWVIDLCGGGENGNI